MTHPPVPPVCPECGVALQPGAPVELCPSCIFSRMLDSAPPVYPAAEAPSTEPAPDPAVARVVGEYEILSEIARGGMGIVYRARQRRLNRLVALKLLATAGPSPGDFLQRFRREAEAAASLDHPNIVPIYEIGEHEGRPYFSMRLIEGGTLADHGRTLQAESGTGWHDTRSVAALLVKIARAVHYAHQRGVLHRDLKPGNILIDACGEPHLTDFGLAKLGDGDSRLTRTMAVLGTPSYMAPEQARGETRRLTTAVDVHGLGAILYELLTGRPPFLGASSIETIREVLECEPRRPSSLRRGLDRDLETICLKCLEKDPEARYDSAEAVARDLEAWLRGEPIHARPPHPVERVVKWARRKPAVAALLTGCVVLLAAGITVATVQSIARHRALVTSRHALYAARLGLVDQAWRDGHVAKARRHLSALQPGPAEDDLRGFEWRYLWHLCRDQSEYTLAREQTPVQSVAASPDGRWVALGGGYPYISLWDVATRKVAFRLYGGKGTRTVTFSPDSRSVAAAGYDGIIRIWDLETQEEISTLAGHSNVIERVAFSPDGARLASASRPDGMVNVWDLATHKPVLTFTGPSNQRPAVAFSRDGTLLAWTAGDRTIRLVSADDGTPRSILRGHYGLIVYLAFSPDHQWLASCDTEGLVKLWSLPHLEDAATLSGHRAWVTSVDFSPDSGQLVTTCVDGTLKLWDLATMKEQRTLKGHEMWVNNAVFLPDQPLVVSGSDDRTMKLWRVDDAPGHREVEWIVHGVDPIPLTAGPPVGPPLDMELVWDDSSYVAFSANGSHLFANGQSPRCVIHGLGGNPLEQTYLLPESVGFRTLLVPDGRHLITADRDGHLRLWDLHNPRRPSSSCDMGTQVTAIALSRDGTRLAAVGGIGKLWLWDRCVPMGQPTATYEFRPGFGTAMTFTADGRRLITAMRLVRSKPTDPPADRLHALRLQDGHIETFEGAHSEWVTAIDASPDGRWLASSSRGGEVRLWNARTLEAVATWNPHAGYVTAAVFSPDSRTLATAGNDGRVKLWSVHSHEELLTLPGAIAAGSRLAFAPDGSMLAACGEDGIVRLWRAPAPTQENGELKEAK